MITDIYIGSDKLDLYEDDNIELKSSIAEIQDVTKVFTDSTNAFSVPANDNNNRIFKHFYNPNLIDGWDVFNKVDAVIDFDGVFYKQVRLSLNKVDLQGGIPISYEIQMYGLLSSLKDIIGDDKLNTLDLSSLNFDYSGANVLDNLITSGSDIVNTTLSTKRLIYDSNPNVDNTDKITNVAFNNKGLNSGLAYSDSNVSVLNIRIIEAIEQRYNIVFSRDFFGEKQFSDLYMLLNGENVENNFESKIVFDNIRANDPTLFNNEILLYEPLTTDITDYIEIAINLRSPFTNSEVTVIIKSNGVAINSNTVTGNSQGDIEYRVKASDISANLQNLTFHIKSKVPVEYRFIVKRRFFRETVNDVGWNTSVLQQNHTFLQGEFNVSNKLPDIKTIDYLTGLFKMFKLTSFSNSNNNIIVDSLSNFYRKGDVKNIDKYVDYSKTEISAGQIFNQINFKFKKSDTILQNEFYRNNNINYGDLEYKIVDINGNLVDGQSIDVKLPFENIIYEKLQDINRTDTIDIMYGYMANDSLEPVNVVAHLHYVANINTLKPFKVLTGTNEFTVINKINVATHTLEFNTPQYSTVFGQEVNEYNGTLINNTLYTNYHEEYILNAFNSQKRIFKLSCQDLPVEFLRTLKLNDVIQIKDDYYRINKYNLNLITKKIDFELYNVKNLNLTPLFNLTIDSDLVTVDSILITTDTTINKEITPTNLQ